MGKYIFLSMIGIVYSKYIYNKYKDCKEYIKNKIGKKYNNINNYYIKKNISDDCSCLNCKDNI